jgi:hypothetical protein
MKLLTLLCAFGCWAFAAAAETKSDATRADKEPSAEEIQTIRKILELPPERLSRIRAAIEKMERMTPEARKDFADSLAKFETATPEDRRKLVKEMREHGPGSRALEHYLKTLPAEKAKEERARINALPPERRQEFIHGLVEKFGPELGKEKGKKDGGKARKTEGDAPAAPPAAGI